MWTWRCLKKQTSQAHNMNLNYIFIFAATMFNAIPLREGRDPAHAPAPTAGNAFLS